MRLTPVQTGRNNVVKKMRKVFFAVAYVAFLKKEARRLSEKRRMNLKSFWKTKFEVQINSLKNWFLDAFKYSFSIVLEKGKLNFVYFKEKSEKIKL